MVADCIYVHGPMAGYEYGMTYGLSGVVWLTRAVRREYDTTQEWRGTKKQMLDSVLLRMTVYITAGDYCTDRRWLDRTSYYLFFSNRGMGWRSL